MPLMSSTTYLLSAGCTPRRTSKGSGLGAVARDVAVAGRDHFYGVRDAPAVDRADDQSPCISGFGPPKSPSTANKRQS